MQSHTPKKPQRGLFISFEGIDGCGKSTQAKLAATYLRKLGYTVAALREPGSCGASERIRKILLDKNLSIDPYPELWLYLAARGQIVNQTIIPALSEGRVVLCDRFHDSTVAYQGYGRQLDLKLIERCRKHTVGTVMPDLTLVFDIDLKTSLSRRKKNADRLERESELFFKRVRAGFRKIANENPRRTRLINSSPAPGVIFEQVKQELNSLLKRKARNLR